MYLDANNLYGWATSQYLPTGNFKWMTHKRISKIDLGKYKADGKKGLILEVDLEYPRELHDMHNDYPVCPEKVKVSKNMLSAYCKRIAEKYNISTGLVSRLIPTLRDKKEYVLHYRNLQLYLDLGLKITKVHRVLKFDQIWLKQYIDFNTEKRKHAKNSSLMYDFHYNYIKKKYNNRARLLFTDTDSLTYEIEAEDVYKDFWNDKDMFDNSDYHPESSPYYCNVNKKIIGKFKDEACSIPITEFIGLKSKMYSYVKDNEKGGGLLRE